MADSEASSDRKGASTPSGGGASISVTQEGKTQVVALAGEIDIVVAPGLQREIETLLADPPPRIVIDLSAVTFLASAGLAMLTACRQAAGDDTAFAVVADGPATARPIELTGLTGELGVCPTMEQALQR